MQPDYLSYLLRLWRVSGEEGAPGIADEAVWHASLEDPHTGQRQGFASPDKLFDYLQAQMGLAPVGAPTSDDQSGRQS